MRLAKKLMILALLFFPSASYCLPFFPFIKGVYLVIGVPGVGKSTTMELLAAYLKEQDVSSAVINYGNEMVRHFPGGRDEMRAATRDEQLRIGLLAARSINAKAKNGSGVTFVDTHGLIWSPKGLAFDYDTSLPILNFDPDTVQDPEDDPTPLYVEGLSNEVVRELAPIGVFFFFTDAKNIVKHRQKDRTRKRDGQSVKMIERHQNDTLAYLNAKFPGKVYSIYIPEKSENTCDASPQIKEIYAFLLRSAQIGNSSL